MERVLFYRALDVVLDITIDNDLDINDYLPNLNRMYGSEVMENVVGSVTGDVKFSGLTKTSMKLEGLDKHLKLIESYGKLHKARGGTVMCGRPFPRKGTRDGAYC